MKIVKNISFLKVSGKMDCTIEFSVLFPMIAAPLESFCWPDVVYEAGLGILKTLPPSSLARRATPRGGPRSLCFRRL